MGKNFLDELSEKYESFSESEKALASFIASNREKALYMSIYELSESASVSVATAVRFCQKLGFSGYKDFRIQLAKANVAGENNDEKVTGSIIEEDIDAMKLTMKEMDSESVSKGAKLISEAGKILIFGTGTSYIAGSDAAIKFRRTGKCVFDESDLYKAALNLAFFGEGDVLLAFSHSGENRATVKICEAAKRRGIKVIAITSFPKSRITKSADVLLFTKTNESPLHKMSITSRISQVALTDALFMEYFALKRDELKGNIEKVSALVKELDIV